jgi:hypothetical protein
VAFELHYSTSVWVRFTHKAAFACPSTAQDARQQGTLRFLYFFFHPGGMKKEIQRAKTREMRKS